MNYYDIIIMFILFMNKISLKSFFLEKLKFKIIETNSQYKFETLFIFIFSSLPIHFQVFFLDLFLFSLKLFFIEIIEIPKILPIFRYFIFFIFGFAEKQSLIWYDNNINLILKINLIFNRYNLMIIFNFKF